MREKWSLCLLVDLIVKAVHVPPEVGISSPLMRLIHRYRRCLLMDFPVSANGFADRRTDANGYGQTFPSNTPFHHLTIVPTPFDCAFLPPLGQYINPTHALGTLHFLFLSLYPFLPSTPIHSILFLIIVHFSFE